MSAEEKAFMEKRTYMRYEVNERWKNTRVPEPYVSTLLPLWSYMTPEAARISSQNLLAKFLEYDARDDFIGMDLTCKLIQKGADVAYQDALFMSQRTDDVEGVSLRWSRAGRKRKLEQSSSIFWEVWKLCDKHEGYNRRTLQFLEEQKQWQAARVKTKRIQAETEETAETAEPAETPEWNQPEINTFTDKTPA